MIRGGIIPCSKQEEIKKRIEETRMNIEELRRKIEETKKDLEKIYELQQVAITCTKKNAQSY